MQPFFLLVIFLIACNPGDVNTPPVVQCVPRPPSEYTSLKDNNADSTADVEEMWGRTCGDLENYGDPTHGVLPTSIWYYCTHPCTTVMMEKTWCRAICTPECTGAKTIRLDFTMGHLDKVTFPDEVTPTNSL